MSHIQASTKINARAENLWQEVGSFQCVADWHPMLAKVDGDGEQPGAVRRAETTDGQWQTERLQEIVPGQHLYRYAIVETAMPVRDYIAEFRVIDNRDGTCTVCWTSDFEVTSGDVSKTEDLVRHFFTIGLLSLRKRHRSQTTDD